MTELFLSFLPFTSLAWDHSNQLEYIQKSLEYTMSGPKVSPPLFYSPSAVADDDFPHSVSIELLLPTPSRNHPRHIRLRTITRETAPRTPLKIPSPFSTKTSLSFPLPQIFRRGSGPLRHVLY